MIAELMEHHHARCDAYFTRAEEAADGGDVDAARSLFDAFEEAMDAHFSIEDDVLFPRFEAITGYAGGPTAVMRSEHQQMRSVLMAMRTAIDDGAADEFLDQCETLHFLLQQHNMKEEQILYPMLDQMLAADAEDLATRIRALPGTEDAA